MILNLTSQEILQFQCILPGQGSLKTLDMVQKILDKSKINDIDCESKEIDFTDEEIEFMNNFINILDQNQQISIQALSLVRKILKEKKSNG